MRTKPIFAKRHYEAIALAMQEAMKDASMAGEYEDGVHMAIDALCTAFTRDNPEFKPERFRTTCMPGNNVKARS